MKRTLAVGVVSVAVLAGAASGWALTGHSSTATTSNRWSIASAQSVLSPVTFGGQAGERQNKNPADAIARLHGASPTDATLDAVTTTAKGENLTIAVHVKHLDPGLTFPGGGRSTSVWLNLMSGNNDQAGILSLTNAPADSQANKPIFTCGEVKPALFPQAVVSGGFDYAADMITFTLSRFVVATDCPGMTGKQVTVDGDVMLYDWWNKTTATPLFDSGVWKAHIHGPVVRTPTVSAAAATTSPSTPPSSQNPRALNLQISDAIRAELVAAGAKLKGLRPSDFTGLESISTYVAYDPVTKTYWAGATLVPSPSSISARVSVQDDGGYTLFHRSGTGPWVAIDTALAGPNGPKGAKPCTVMPPADVLTLWGWPAHSCHPSGV